MPHLFKNESGYPLVNAQRNLMGRTHYVDPDTLRFHKSRVLAARVIDQGLLFAIITSDALDYQNSKRGFRYVVFDLFGNVVARPDLEHSYSKRAAADNAMWAAVNALDAKAITREGIAKAEKHHASEMRDLRETLAKLKVRAS